MINKGCEVKYYFENGFILGEEHLQTLSSKIKERYPEEELIYKITKSNSYIFQTLDINEIFKEENSNADFINKLDIIIDNGDRINFSLCFEKGEDTFLKIIGDDKDKIYLLYNEIKTYVEKDITIVKTDLKYHVLKEICYIMQLILLLVFICMLPKLLLDNENINDILNSSDLAIKLNYIIERGSLKDIEKYFYFLVLIFFLMIIPTLLRFLWGKKGVLRITDYFLFGKQKSIYDKKIKVKNNIIWTVGIGLAVSIIGGFFVYLFTK